MSLSDRDWTQFQIDAEVDSFGTSRVVSEHNRLRAEVARLREKLERHDKFAVKMDSALGVLRHGMGGHNHWDDTMQYGRGCKVCIAQQEAVEKAYRMRDEAYDIWDVGFLGSNEVSRAYSPPEEDKPLLPPWESA